MNDRSSGLTGDREGLWAGWNWRRAPIANDVRRMYDEDRSAVSVCSLQLGHTTVPVPSGLLMVDGLESTSLDLQIE